MHCTLQLEMRAAAHTTLQLFHTPHCLLQLCHPSPSLNSSQVIMYLILLPRMLPEKNKSLSVTLGSLVCQLHCCLQSRGSRRVYSVLSGNVSNAHPLPPRPRFPRPTLPLSRHYCGFKSQYSRGSHFI